jgi:indolepyruvate ferredoxin oxidoreductase
VTIGALMGMAAHIEGKGVLVLDMAGVAQKGGAVVSHVRLAAEPSQLHGARVGSRQADLVLGCDLMVASGNDGIRTMSGARTRALMNTDVAPTGTFTQSPDWEASSDDMLKRVRSAARETEAIDATRLATALMGDAVATNVFLLGFAWQKGWLPLSEAALREAIELNGAAVAMNQGAFAWGRQAALDMPAVRKAAGLDRVSEAVVMLMPERTPPLQALLADRKARLTSYQNRAYAERYELFVREIAAAEASRIGGDRLAREVAVSLYKLMAYKDEYEVARLYVESDFFERIEREFEGDYRLRFHLAPPLLSRRDADGHLLKKVYGPWIATAFKCLAKAKVLRGSALDIFGYTAERRGEREAIAEFEALMRRVVRYIDADRLSTAVELARLPQTVRGFGHVKARNAEAARMKRDALLARFFAPQTRPVAEVA